MTAEIIPFPRRPRPPVCIFDLRGKGEFAHWLRLLDAGYDGQAALRLVIDARPGQWS
jgi:hypothetical protein